LDPAKAATSAANIEDINETELLDFLAARFVESARLLHVLGAGQGVALNLVGLATIMLERQDLAQAVRLLSVAEIGWSPMEGRDWAEYRQRLGSHGPRLTALRVNFYPAETIPWR
jgi:hypothetical protein